MAQSIMPQAHEYLYHSSVNYSLSQSTFERICYIAPFKDHVNLGFMFGVHLDDPEGLLEGEGERLRHVKVRSANAADNPALKALVKAAWADGPQHVAQLKQSRKRKLSQ
jgi:hypothetical protein